MSKNSTAKGNEAHLPTARRPAPDQAPQQESLPADLAPGALLGLPHSAADPTLRRRAALRLQRSHGNHFVRRWIQGRVRQAPPGAVQRLTDEERRQLFTEARAAYANGDYAAAFAGFDRLVTEGNLPPDALRQVRYNRGQALLRLGRADEAQADLDAYIADATPEERRNAAREVFRAAEAAFRSGDYAGALALDNSLLATMPMDPAGTADIRYNRARALQALGRHDEAIPDLQAYLDTPQSPEGRQAAARALLRAASAQYQAGEPAAAADLYYVLLNAGFSAEANQGFLYNYALARQAQGQHAEAIARFEQYRDAAESASDRAAAEERIAISRAALGQGPDGAQPPDEQAADADPQPVEGLPDEGAAAGTDGSGGAYGSGSAEAATGNGATPDTATGRGAGATPAERLQRALELYHGADYWGAIPILEQIRDSREATDQQRLEAQRHIGLAYHEVGSHTFAAHNLRRYLRMPGADPALVRDALEISERENERAGRAR